MPVVHRAAAAFGSWLLGLVGTETVISTGKEEEEELEAGEPRILWNFGYKNICKKKCCYKCCELNKIICLIQLLLLVAIIAVLIVLIRIEMMGGRRRKRRRRRKRTPPSPTRSPALDAVLDGIGAAFRDVRDEARAIAVEYEPLSACPAAGGRGEKCARWSWVGVGGMNQTLLPPTEAFGQECF